MSDCGKVNSKHSAMQRLPTRHKDKMARPASALSISPPRLPSQSTQVENVDVDAGCDELRLGELLLDTQHVSLDTVERRIAQCNREQKVFSDDRCDLDIHGDAVDGIMIRLLNRLERMPLEQRTRQQEAFLRAYSIESVQLRTADTIAVLDELIEQCKLDRQMAMQTRHVMLSMFPEATTSPRTSCCDLRKSPPPHRSPASLSPRATLAAEDVSSERSLPPAAKCKKTASLVSPRQWLRKNRAESESALMERFERK